MAGGTVQLLYATSLPTSPPQPSDRVRRRMRGVLHTCIRALLNEGTLELGRYVPGRLRLGRFVYKDALNLGRFI